MDPTLFLGLMSAIAGLASAGVAIIGFWLALQRQISRAQADASNSIQVAAEADKETKELHGRITALSGSFALYREQAIEKFVTHSTLAGVEMRLVESQAKSEQRLVDALEGLNKRLDRLIEVGLGAKAGAS